ncbi:alpha/beta fold hydrolase [bacterium]|nr:alpha/beta fold hydrolase [bacterium]
MMCLRKYFLFTLFTLIGISSQNLLAANSCIDLFRKELISVKDSRDVVDHIQKTLRNEQELGVLDENKTQFLLVRDSSNQIKKTPVSVVILHGLFNSPAWTKWMAQRAHEMGLNVINMRLPHHYTGQRDGLDHFSASEAIREVQKTTDIAKKLGDKVVFIGHSAGGTLAVFSALNNLPDTAGMILFSPALETQKKLSTQSVVLSRLGISGKQLDKIPALRDPDDRYISTKAGVEVAKMGEDLANLRGFETNEYQRPYGFILQRLNSLPLFWVDTAIDNVVSLKTNEDVATNLENTTYISIASELKMAHKLTATEPSQSQPQAEYNARVALTNQWTEFLRSLSAR